MFMATLAISSDPKAKVVDVQGASGIVEANVLESEPVPITNK